MNFFIHIMTSTSLLYTDKCKLISFKVHNIFFFEMKYMYRYIHSYINDNSLMISNKILTYTIINLVKINIFHNKIFTQCGQNFDRKHFLDYAVHYISIWNVVDWLTRFESWKAIANVWWSLESSCSVYHSLRQLYQVPRLHKVQYLITNYSTTSVR